MPERFAIYYAPAADDPLWAKAAEWLGRDPLTGATIDGPLHATARNALFERSISARRYGFHATIKAPYVSATEPVAIGPIKLALIDGFLALIPATQSEALTAFAGDVVETFDPFRAPPSDEERARRLQNGNLSPRQLELLEGYGYPYVFEQFQLHMTLTDRLPEGERAAYMQAAAEHFGPLAEADMAVDRLVLFHEPEAGAPFARLDDFMLTGETADARIRAR